MKEASGELSMTAVAVVAIAAIGVVFTTLIWPSIKSNITRSTKCTQAFSCTCTAGQKCVVVHIVKMTLARPQKPFNAQIRTLIRKQ